MFPLRRLPARGGQSRIRSGSGVKRGGPAHAAGIVVLPNAQLIVHVPNAPHLAGEVLGEVLHVALVDLSAQGHFAVLDIDVHVGRIDIGVIRQSLNDVFADAFVRTLVVLRTTAGVSPAVLAANAVLVVAGAFATPFAVVRRSEERRVGKECRSGWWA